MAWILYFWRWFFMYLGKLRWFHDSYPNLQTIFGFVPFPYFSGGQFSPQGCGVVSRGWPSATPIFFSTEIPCTTSGWFELSHLKNLRQIELRNPNWRQVKIPKNDWKSPPRWCLIPSLLSFWFAFKLYSFQSLLRYPRNPTGKLHSSLPAECLGIFYHNPVRSLPNLSPVNGLIFLSCFFKEAKRKSWLQTPKEAVTLLVCLMTLAFLASINITIFFGCFWYINPRSHVFGKSSPQQAWPQRCGAPQGYSEPSGSDHASHWFLANRQISWMWQE